MNQFKNKLLVTDVVYKINAYEDEIVMSGG